MDRLCRTWTLLKYFCVRIVYQVRTICKEKFEGKITSTIRLRNTCFGPIVSTVESVTVPLQGYRPAHWRSDGLIGKYSKYNEFPRPMSKQLIGGIL